MNPFLATGSARAAVLVLGLMGLAACGDAAPPPEARQSKAERLVVALRSAPDRREFAGTVTTERTAEARARINGTLARVLVREGDTVKAGDVLAEIEDRHLVLLSHAAEAQVTAATGEAERAEAELARTRALFEQGIYAAARLQTDKARADAAAGTLTAARAQFAASREVLAQGAVRAGADGRVLRADVPAGSVVTAGQTVITLTAGDGIIRLDVPETQAQALKVGAAAAVRLQDQNQEGRIAQVYPESRAGAVRVDIAVEGLEAAFSGQKASVTVDVGARERLLIPRRFVRSRFGLETVLLADKNQANAAPVAISVQLAPGPTGAEVEVVSGLSAGDVIVLPEARE